MHSLFSALVALKLVWSRGEAAFVRLVLVGLVLFVHRMYLRGSTPFRAALASFPAIMSFRALWLFWSGVLVVATRSSTTTDAAAAENLRIGGVHWAASAHAHSVLRGAYGVPPQVLRALDLDAPPLLPPSDRRIWAFWEGPVPEVVAFAARTWEGFNPGIEVRLLNVSSPFFPWEILSHLTVRIGVAGKTDLLRLHLLAKYGGVWLDASDISTGPGLFNILSNAKRPVVMKGLQPSPTTDRSACTWFIYAREARLPLLVTWRHLVLAYLFRARAEPIATMFGSSNPAMDHVQSLVDAGVAREHVGGNVTGQLALDDLERVGRWPYFFAHYLLNEVSELTREFASGARGWGE